MRKTFALLFSLLLLASVSFAQEKRPVRVNNADDVADLIKDAEDGDRGAQFELSMVYMYKQDAQNQLKWLTLSAENGFGKAQYVLGNLYYNGTSKIPKDYEKAAHWFGAAKKTGFNGGAGLDEKIEDSFKKLELAKKRADEKASAERAKKERQERERQAAKDNAKKAARDAAKEAADAIRRAAAEEVVFATIASQQSAASAAKLATEKILSAKFVREEDPKQKSGLFEKIKTKVKALLKEIL
jgi:hypothetical protein